MNLPVERGLKCKPVSHEAFLLTHSCDSSAASKKDFGIENLEFTASVMCMQEAGSIGSPLEI